jgi:hypothetical protein
MKLTLDIPDNVVVALKAKADGLALETFVEHMLLAQIRREGASASSATIADAARRLASFGERHGLSLGGMTIRELRDESRP